MSSGLQKAFHSFLTVLMIVIIGTFISVHRANAQDDDKVQLEIQAVDASQGYFDLEVKPGESRQITVELRNSGIEAAPAYVYPANVYTLVNGGMGVKSAEAPKTDATTWVDFQEDTLQLNANESVLRSFSITVPEDAEPGEHITSIVIQEAPEAANTSDESIVLNKVYRQAVAVLVTVPGDVERGLTIGGVSHSTPGGKSAVQIGITNTGDMRIRPSGEFILSDMNGVELTRYPVTMSSIYAGDMTAVEVPFTMLLNPGDYLVSLSLADEEKEVSASATNIMLTVSASEGVDNVSSSSGSNGATVDQESHPSEGGSTAATSNTSESSALILIAIGAVAGAVVAGGLVGGIFLTRRRKASASTATRKMSTSRMAAPVAAATATTPVVHPSESVKRLVPRSSGDQGQ